MINRFRCYFAPVSILIFMSGCSRVVAGTYDIIAPQSAKAVVHIMYKKRSGPAGSCSGVRVSPSFVLTAGHCISDSVYNRPWVQLLNAIPPIEEKTAMQKSIERLQVFTKDSLPVMTGARGERTNVLYSYKQKQRFRRARYFRPLHSAVPSVRYFDRTREISHSEATRDAQGDLALMVFVRGRKTKFREKVILPDFRNPKLPGSGCGALVANLFGRGRLPFSDKWNGFNIGIMTSSNSLGRTAKWTAIGKKNEVKFSDGKSYQALELKDVRVPSGNSGGPIFGTRPRVLRGIISSSSFDPKDKTTFGVDLCNQETRRMLCELLEKTLNAVRIALGKNQGESFLLELKNEAQVFGCSKAEQSRDGQVMRVRGS